MKKGIKNIAENLCKSLNCSIFVLSNFTAQHSTAQHSTAHKLKHIFKDIFKKTSCRTLVR